MPLTRADLRVRPKDAALDDEEIEETARDRARRPAPRRTSPRLTRIRDALVAKGRRGDGRRSAALGLEARPWLTKPVIVAPGAIRPFLEPLLPLDAVEVHWFADVDEAIALAPLADIGWLDILRIEDDPRPCSPRPGPKWLHTTLAGLSKIPVGFARERNILVTKGTGLTSRPSPTMG